MRLAVIGTPRSGNSLLRKTLARAHGLDETASHDPAFLLGDLALGTVAQVHAPYSPELHASLRKRSVIVVTPRRHPLDVLLSMLHFAQFEPDVSYWLDGNYLDGLEGCDPSSRAFRAFALGEGSARLLSVSVGWSAHADVIVEYADLVADPTMVLADDAFGAYPQVGERSLVLEAGSFEGFHRSGNMHGWLGQSGYWTSFISRDFAEEIKAAHPEAFVAGDYDMSGARDLTGPQVRMAWASSFAGRPDRRG
jgi:hypothetical protein